LKKAGTDFAKGAEHGAPKPTAGAPPKPPEAAPKPESGAPGAKPNGAPKPMTIDQATWMAGRPVTAAVREIKNADGSLSLFVRMDDGTFARAETVRQFDYEVLRLSGDGIPKGKGTVLYRDAERPEGAAYVRQPDGAPTGLAGGASDGGITITGSNREINSDGDLRTVLNDGLNVKSSVDSNWTFPARTNGGDGRVGKLCVSKMHALDVKGATDQLAVHTTFSLKIAAPSKAAFDRVKNAATKVEMKVTVTNLHFTCRPKRLQVKISDTGDGSFAQTPSGAEASSHRGINNAWLHDSDDKRLQTLAIALGLPTGNWTKAEIDAARGAIDKALERYDGQALTALRAELRKSFQVELNDTLKPDPTDPKAINPRGNVNIVVDIDGNTGEM
jgi:hypothetical protein